MAGPAKPLRVRPPRNGDMAKNAVLLDLIAHNLGTGFGRILVVGCGAGHEAAALADRFDARVVGIDLQQEFAFLPPDDDRVELREMNACALRFEDDSFDLVYSFHALEHIQPLDDALAEMRRVLRPGGAFCFGTPNKSRWVGYLGSATSWLNKLRWNMADWRQRLRGRWRNELGAHAGFTREELRSICAQTFGATRDVTDDYYRRLYGRRHPKLINAALASPLKHKTLPCVYMLGHGTAVGRPSPRNH